MNKIGIDIDHTLLDYKKSIEMLIFRTPELKDIVAHNKEELKNSVIQSFGSMYWTELQGKLYGEYVRFATLYEGAHEVLTNLTNLGFSWCLVSHKTRFPIEGRPIDLRNAATEALARLGVGTGEKFQSGPFFFETKEDKIQFINKSNFAFFVDDLLEILVQIDSNVKKILFSPNKSSSCDFALTARNWMEVGLLIERS
jgi:hypothetical protein